MPPPVELSAGDARRLVLRAQGLIGRPPEEGVRPMLRRLGAVQLDTISVLARSHELVAYARLGPVGRAAVEEAYWGRPARAFEALAHAMCILPIELWPYLAARRRRSARRTHPSRPHDSRAMKQVVAELEARGPLTASDLGGSRSKDPRPENVWWHWSPEKVALERLLAVGTVVCVERVAWRRVYDLAERAIPPRLLARDPDDASCHAKLIALAAERLGVGTLDDLRGYFGGMYREQAAAAIDAAGLIPVRVAGWTAPAWAGPVALAALGAGAERGRHRTTLLSPFDSLVWDRARLLRIFGLAHKLEAYTPAAERVHGYFAMPVLAGGRIVGRVDPGRDGTTLIAKRVSAALGTEPAIARALVEAAGWVGCDAIRVTETRPTALRVPLRRALAQLL
ncbi:MAG: crosslink repair DNA glycosylase YcaQ family protein [Candidatus Limnocylindrales bacterium]